ncbi:MAG: TIGR03936 family radical SAM-associated protein [Acidimicrobiales bacterium]
MKVRFRFTKQGKVRWTSHRDVARMWERALRRAAVPVAYSEGFSPRPKISFGLALPTGAESVAEYLDIDLGDSGDEPGPGDLEGLAGAVGPMLPDGIDVSAAAAMGPGEPSLQHDVVACRWEIGIPSDVGFDQPAGLEETVAEVLAAEEIVVTRERKGQAVTDDIRPSILALSALSGPQRSVVTLPGPGRVLGVELATVGRGLRPAELLTHLGVDPAGVRMVRTHQWIERDGARREPIPAGATDAPPVVRQAS